MTLILRVRSVKTGRVWTEDYDSENLTKPGHFDRRQKERISVDTYAEAESWGKALIDWFNSTCAPYTQGEVRAYAPWTDHEVTDLAEALSGFRGSWVVTLNDSEANRAAFSGCQIIAVSTAANMSNARNPGRRFGEIIIRPRRQSKSVAVTR